MRAFILLSVLWHVVIVPETNSVQTGPNQWMRVQPFMDFGHDFATQADCEAFRTSGASALAQEKWPGLSFGFQSYCREYAQ